MKSVRKVLFLGAVCVLFGARLFLPAQSAPPAADAPRFNFGGDAATLAPQFTDFLLFLSARVNGSAPSVFELDTAAATTSLSSDRAAQIDRVNVASPVLNFEGMDVPYASLPAISKPEFTSTLGQAYQGTLGRDFLSRLVLDVDYHRQTVRAYAPGSYKYSGKGKALPLANANAAPTVTVRFALEKGKEVNATFLVDTALDAPVVVNNKFLAAHHMLGDRGRTIPAIDPFTGAPNASLGHLRMLEMEKMQPPDVLAIFSDQAFADSSTPLAGAIGSEFLRRFNIVFDYPHHQLMLDANLNFPDPDEEDKSGLLVTASGVNYKTFAVANVAPNSPASFAGLKKGDIIEGVDTDPAADLTLLTLRDLFIQVGHKYKVTYQRDNQIKDVTIQMRRYL
jgi:hypothetical protein